MTTILTPILVLVAWTLVVWVWMVGTRVPAMQKAKMHPQKAARTNALDLPTNVLQVSDNYNHLMEQPTIFYALIAYVYLAGAESQLNIALAWAYVGLRIAHSLVQNTVNVVMIRFYLFVASTLCLVAIVVEQAMHLAP